MSTVRANSLMRPTGIKLLITPAWWPSSLPVYHHTGHGNTYTFVNGAKRTICFWCRNYHFKPNLQLLPKVDPFDSQWEDTLQQRVLLSSSGSLTTGLFDPSLKAISGNSWLSTLFQLIVLLFLSAQITLATQLWPLNRNSTMFCFQNHLQSDNCLPFVMKAT